MNIGLSHHLLKAKTVVIPIEGEINPPVLKFLERAVTDATNKEMAADRIIFQINTFGGRVDTTYEIVDLILSIKLETISVVKEKAISAGTLIALSAQSLYMFKNSTLGDVAPIMMGQSGPQMLGEKFQSPLRAKFRSLAQKNGYPVKLSEAFVSEQIEIIEVTWKNGEKEILTGVEYKDLTEDEKKEMVKRKTLVKEGELLTMSDVEAYNFGFSSQSISDIKEVVSDEVVYIEESQSEQLYAFLNKYAFILILIGLGGIYLEVKNPGFGFYGIAAIISFALFFISHYVVELATYLELLLMILGIGLIVVEVFILPGFGIFGISGILILISSLILMMQNFTIPVEDYQFDLFFSNIYTVFLSFIASTLLFLISLVFFPKVFKRNPLVFSASNSTETIPISDNSNDSSSGEMESLNDNKPDKLIGAIGVTYCDLHPNGIIKIDENTYDASTEGEFLATNTKVEVIGYRFGSYIVKPVKNNSV